jgi:prepilin-type N-terminal cleavage/methylation domain-containing protein
MKIKISKSTNLQICKSGFTLIELLVVISIIGILIGLSVIGLQGSRKASRDAVRKADLEQIRSGLGMYRADCNVYPPALVLSGPGSLSGDGTSSPSCLATNVYIAATPTDPISPGADYVYSSNGVTYTICASLEQPPSPALDVSGCGSCGGATCNYKVTNP